MLRMCPPARTCARARTRTPQDTRACTHTHARMCTHTYAWHTGRVLLCGMQYSKLRLIRTSCATYISRAHTHVHCAVLHCTALHAACTRALYFRFERDIVLTDTVVCWSISDHGCSTSARDSLSFGCNGMGTDVDDRVARISAGGVDGAEGGQVFDGSEDKQAVCCPSRKDVAVGSTDNVTGRSKDVAPHPTRAATTNLLELVRACVQEHFNLPLKISGSETGEAPRLVIPGSWIVGAADMCATHPSMHATMHVHRHAHTHACEHARDHARTRTGTACTHGTQC